MWALEFIQPGKLVQNAAAAFAALCASRQAGAKSPVSRAPLSGHRVVATDGDSLLHPLLLPCSYPRCIMTLCDLHALMLRL